MLEQARRKLILTTTATVAVIALILVVLFVGVGPNTGTTVATVKQAHITITDHGFVPSSLQIDKGTTVVWENTSNAPRQVAANPFADHSSLPSLFAATATAPGDLYSFTFSQVGEFGYHDELNPQMNASVTVK